MNLTPEAFEQVLSELADRADAHPVPDRVPAVRGRARRTSRRRAGAAAVALAVVVVMASGVAGFDGLPRLRGQGPAHRPDPVKPSLSIQLARDTAEEAKTAPRFSGGRVVVVKVTLRGRVPRWTGYQDGADVKDNLWDAQLIADGGNKTVQVRPTNLDFECDPHAPLVDMDSSFLVHLDYRPGVVTPVLGRHDLRFTASACAPVSVVQQTLSVVVK